MRWPRRWLAERVAERVAERLADTLAWMRRWSGRRWAYTAGAALLIVCVLGSLLAVLRPVANGAPGAGQGAPPRVKLSGVVPPVRAKAQRIGRERGSTVVQLSIALRLANPHALQQLVAGQQNPHSGDYHHYLTPQTFADTYGPPASAVKAVTSFLQAAGLRVTGVAPNHLLVDATGTVTQVEKAFGVTVGQYQVSGHTYYAPDGDPTLPTALAPYVQNVGGLDSFFHMAPHDVIQHAQGAPGQAGQGSTPHAEMVTYGPTDLQGAYDVGPLLSSINSGSPTAGSKGDVAVFELAPYIPSDVTNYRSTFSLPSSPINAHAVDGAAVTCLKAGSSCDISGVAEADLDLEVVSALAPYATQEVYTGPNTTTGVNDTYTRIVTSNTARAITTSWGLCEPYTGQAELVALDNIFLQAQAQGQTVFAAAGDAGTDDCRIGGNPAPTVDSPASDPHVVAVGGTTLTLSSGGAYSAETVWNNTSPAGSGDASSDAGGGGLSSYFSPAQDPSTGTSYQYGQGVTNTYATGQRQVPDVTADADPNTGYYLYCTSSVDCPGGQWWSGGGTSAATPLWAALYNDMDVYYGSAASPAGQHIGWGYAVLYQLFANAQTYTPYHDVTTGNNDIDNPSGQYAGLYPATSCYDLASGVGSPDAWAMARDIAAGVKTAGGGPCGASPVTSLIKDGGFESGSTYWQTFSLRGDQVITANGPHLGADAFTPCQSVGCDDRVWQTVTVPATVQSASLTFWVNGLSTATGSGACADLFDHFYVLLTAADGTVIDTANTANGATTCAFSTSGQYVALSYNVTSVLQAHQGQSLIVMLRATNTNLSSAPGAGIFWHVDDVALDVS